MSWHFDQWKNKGVLPAEAAERGGGLSMQSGPRRSTRSISGCSPTPTPSTSATCSLQTYALFDRFPEVRDHYSGAGSYVLVDEYQDTNRVQYRLVNQLVGGASATFLRGR